MHASLYLSNLILTYSDLTLTMANEPNPTKLVLEQIVPSLISTINTNQVQVLDRINQESISSTRKFEELLHELRLEVRNLAHSEVTFRLGGASSPIETRNTSHSSSSYEENNLDGNTYLYTMRLLIFYSQIDTKDGSVPGRQSLPLSLSRSLSTVHDLWREYKIGINGNPPAESCPKRYQSNETERRFFTRRNIIWTRVSGDNV
jgi:hypothetical protein